MNVLVTGNGYGLIETITGAMSIHSIKKGLTSTFVDEAGRIRTKYGTLKDHFVQKFGPEKSTTYVTAQSNFIRSLAGYSIATYVLSLRDRHNSNVLIDEEGHIVRTSQSKSRLTPQTLISDFSYRIPPAMEWRSNYLHSN
jgi:phosphatidylinositol 4-kinase B